MNSTTLSAIIVAIVIAFGIWYQVSNKEPLIVGSEITPKTTAENKVITVSDDKKQQMPETNNVTTATATFETSLGSFVIEFFDKQAPKTVANFKKLAESNFYDGVKFHRVIKGFMVQGGDPLTKDDTKVKEWGSGGPGYKFEDEISANNKNLVGTISMANAGPNTNGSQFFINVADNNFLDPRHTVFGKVISGMEVVKKIENVQTSEADRPLEPVVIKNITIK